MILTFVDANEAEEIAKEHLSMEHNINVAEDLPEYVDATWTPVEVLAQMTTRGDCTHRVMYAEITED